MIMLASVGFARPRTPRTYKCCPLIGLIAIVALFGSPARAQATEMVSYCLTPRVETGRLSVELTWNTAGRTLSAAYIAPHWGTVGDVPTLLRNVRFGGGVTGVRKKGSRWLLQHARGATVTCRYEVDPGFRRLSWKGPHFPVTTSSFFHGLGNTFLITPESGNGLPELYDVTLRWKLPPEWKAVCSWGVGRHIGAQMTPDDIRHSVYLAGRIVTHTVERGGHTVTVALRDRFRFDAEEFAEMAATLVAHECRFMGETDFPPFLVVAVPVGEPIGPGESRLVGMGLYRSFALLAAPASSLTTGFESLFAHELFHYWNGRILKAKQPDKLAYWFVEGFTEYYALRILHDSGYWKPAVYAERINRHVRDYHNNPAIHVTNQEILDRYWQERDTVGEVPYQRGVLLGLRWHRMARDRGIADGLDRLFKKLVEHGRSGGFEVSNEAVRRIGVQTLGAWFGPEFDRFVTRAETVDVPLNALAPALTGEYTQVYQYELGFDARQAAKSKRIHNLVRNSAAQQAGLREGDQLVGAKVHSDPNQQIALQVRRSGKTKTIRYYPRGRRTYTLQFQPAR